MQKSPLTIKQFDDSKSESCNNHTKKEFFEVLSLFGSCSSYCVFIRDVNGNFAARFAGEPLEYDLYIMALKDMVKILENGRNENYKKF